MLNAELVVVAVGVTIPDMYAIIYEVLDVGIALQEPQQLVYHALQKDALGGKQREALAEVEAHLIAEDALGACACAVVAHYALTADFIE